MLTKLRKITDIKIDHSNKELATIKKKRLKHFTSLLDQKRKMI